MNEKTSGSKEARFYFGWILRLIAFSVAGILLSGLIFLLVSKATGIPEHELVAISEPGQTSVLSVWLLRFMLLTQHVFTFIVPGAIVLYLYKAVSNRSMSGFNAMIDPITMWLAIFLLMASYPVVQFLSEVNLAIPLPEFMTLLQAENNNIIKALLNDRTTLAFLANLIIMALIPAIGEELFFRGVLQTSLTKILRNKDLGVWIGAIVFSALHLQFEGFLPRLALGLVLGYIFLWTGNIIFPIIVHFFNNGAQIAIQHFVIRDINKLDDFEKIKVPFYMVVISIVLMFFLTELIKERIGGEARKT